MNEQPVVDFPLNLLLLDGVQARLPRPFRRQLPIQIFGPHPFQHFWQEKLRKLAPHFFLLHFFFFTFPLNPSKGYSLPNHSGLARARKPRKKPRGTHDLLGVQGRVYDQENAASLLAAQTNGLPSLRGKHQVHLVHL